MIFILLKLKYKHFMANLTISWSDGLCFCRSQKSDFR